LHNSKLKWRLPLQAYCSLNEDIIDFSLLLCLCSASQFHDWDFLLLPKMQQKLRMQISV
jgi:hypothetical protein